VRIESRDGGAALIVVLTPARERNNERAFTEGFLANPSTSLIAVHPWHPDIEQDDVG